MGLVGSQLGLWHFEVCSMGIKINKQTDNSTLGMNKILFFFFHWVLENLRNKAGHEFERVLFFFLTSLLEYNCFTMVF